MQRDEEDGVVAAEDRLGAVAVVHVEVDDCDPLEPELRLRVARPDRNVVHQAEAHGTIGEGMVPGRPHECEPAAVDRLDRDPGSERRRIPRGLRGDGIGVELDGTVERPEEREVRFGVDARELLFARAPVDGLAREPEEPILTFGMISGRVKVRERGVRQEVDSASRRPASRPSPHSSASAAARAQVGSWSSSGGRGASASIVAT
jgi:hypothetical protein